MPIRVIRQDITKISCDAIVSPSNEALNPDGGTALAIHRIAGNGLRKACTSLGGCKTGQAKITPAYFLPCRFVIHTAGPVWQDGNKNEETLLESCYRNSLLLALENGCRSVAFPLISSGSFGFPKDLAFRIAVNTIQEFLSEHDLLVFLVVFDRNSFAVSRRHFDDVQEFIQDTYEAEHTDFFRNSIRSLRPAETETNEIDLAPTACDLSFEIDSAPEAPPIMQKPSASSAKASKRKQGSIPAPAAPSASAPSLSELLGQLDEGFAQALFRLIDQKGLTDVECYKKALVDKKTFSKIKCNPEYRPSKLTVIAFALALELSLEETQHLLKTVGFTLSRSNKFDVIIEYFITRGNYNIYEINETLFHFDQVLIGC